MQDTMFGLPTEVVHKLYDTNLSDMANTPLPQKSKEIFAVLKTLNVVSNIQQFGTEYCPEDVAFPSENFKQIESIDPTHKDIEKWRDKSGFDFSSSAYDFEKDTF